MVFAEAQMQSDAGFYGRYFSQLFVYINQYTVKQDWRGLLILRDRSQGLGWEVPYAELLERRVTQLYLSDLREQDLGEALLDFQGIDDLDDWLQKYTELIR